MKRVSLVLLGLTLLLSGAGFLFGSELARRALERKLDQFLGFPVQIGRVTFTLHRLTLHHVSLRMPAPVEAPLAIDRIQLEGSPFHFSGGRLTLTGLHLSIAGVPLHAQGKVFLTAVPGSYALSEGWLTVDHPLLRGRVEVTGRLLEPVMMGWLQSVRGPPKYFVGQWKVRRDSLQLVRMEMQGGWTAQGQLSSGWGGELNLSGPEERIRFKTARVEPRTLRAECWVYRPDLPAREILVWGSVGRNGLALRAELAGTPNRLNGWVNLRPPHRARLALELQSFRVEELAQWIGGTSPPAVSGRLEGRVDLSGPLQALNSRGELTLREGTLWEGAFETIGIRFQGKGPLLRLESTVRTPSETTYLGEGMVDLRRAGQPEFLNGLRWNSTDRDLQMAGWLMSLAPAGGLQLQRPIGSKESVKISMKKEEQTIALERRKKF